MGKKNKDQDDATLAALNEVVERLDPPPAGLIEKTQFAVGVVHEIENLPTSDD